MNDVHYSLMDDEPDMMPMMSMDEDDDSPDTTYPEQLPLVALRNSVLFPGIMIPITVGRQKSVAAVRQAYSADKYIGVLTQRESAIDDPKQEDLYQVGTIARVVKVLTMPDGNITAILQGRRRFGLLEITEFDPYLVGTHELLHDIEPADDEKAEYTAMLTSIRESGRSIIELSAHIPNEAAVMLQNIEKNGFLLNFSASNLSADITVKQSILEMGELKEKAEAILEHLNKDLQMLEIKDQIENKVRTDIEKQQRDYFLNQQLKTIQNELGNNPHAEDILELKQKAQQKTWPEEAQQAFAKEMKKLERMNPAAAEYSVTMNHLEFMVELPWETYTKDNFDLKKAEKILHRDHYGLDKIKERILEHLAVLKLKQDMKAPILCLVGPPGVGKTSLGKSIAASLNRKYIRMSLGGLHDESELRGHRKTYIGAMAGRILKSIQKVGSSNPVFILDEIDKVGKGFKGDPSSALLEILDPEQNETFHDNFLDVDYDLSKVLFIATANSLSTIQPALRDRMEIIRVSGYSAEEKVQIAKQHLVPDQRKAHGLKGKDVRIKDELLLQIIREYTRESGVRELNRVIGKVMRNIAKRVAMEEQYKPTLTSSDIHDILGPIKYINDIYQDIKTPGVAVGLAWTSVGGEILFIEAILSKGSGKLELTGNLGAVMKESAKTALSFIKAHAEHLHLNEEQLDKTDIHIHVPEGAIPKDGPSAGITMLSALTSAFIGKPIKAGLAMTGEITLRGKVLPVGGIKEKLLAAKRMGLQEVMLCEVNKKDVSEIEPQYLEGLQLHYVTSMRDVLRTALNITMLEDLPAVSLMHNPVAGSHPEIQA